jgi:hypothetical protein
MDERAFEEVRKAGSIPTLTIVGRSVVRGKLKHVTDQNKDRRYLL